MSQDSDYAAREAERKAAYNARTWAMSEREKHKPAKGAVVQTELLIVQIDQWAAAGVRVGLNADAVATYAECEGLPPVDVFEGGGKYFLGDGRHRIHARIAGGHKKILCSVTRCATAEAARTLAILHAGRANMGNGLYRSTADKQAAVRFFLSMPEYADQSDRRIAELVGVVHGVVTRVRDAMVKESKEAGADGPVSKHKSGNPSGKAKGVASEATPSKEEGGRAATPTSPPPAPKPPAAPEQEDEEETPEPPPRVKGDRLLDARGRAVPESLVPLFKFGKSFLSDLRGTIGEVAEGVKTAADEGWGKGLTPILPTVEADLKKVAQDVAASLPFCCCPRLSDDAVHELGGRCQVCVDNRGWLSRHNWHQQSDGVKREIEEKAAEKQPEAA